MCKFIRKEVIIKAKMGENHYQHTTEELRIMQKLDLDSKIKVTKARIIEFNNAFDNKTYISLCYFFLLLLIKVAIITIDCSIPTINIAKEKLPLNISVEIISKNSFIHFSFLFMLV